MIPNHIEFAQNLQVLFMRVLQLLDNSLEFRIVFLEDELLQIVAEILVVGIEEFLFVEHDHSVRRLHGFG